MLPKITLPGGEIISLGYATSITAAAEKDSLFTKAAVSTVLPPSFDLRAHAPPVLNQGQLGSCVLNALSGAWRYMSKKSFVPSRLFGYLTARANEGCQSYDAGCTIMSAMKQGMVKGCCSEADWPYIEDKLTTKPPNKLYTAALKHKITKRCCLAGDKAEDIKRALLLKFPVIVGVRIFSSFLNPGCIYDGLIPVVDTHTDIMLGGHAMVIFAYDDHDADGGVFHVLNSWGTKYGRAGWFRMPYACLQRMLAESWVVQEVVDN